MIVKRKNYEVEDNFREEEIIKIVLNIKEIENMYLSEEKNYVKQMSTIFKKIKIHFNQRHFPAVRLS